MLDKLSPLPGEIWVIFQYKRRGAFFYKLSWTMEKQQINNQSKIKFDFSHILMISPQGNS